MGETTQQPGTALPALNSIRLFTTLTVTLRHLTCRAPLAMPARSSQRVDGGRPVVSLFFVFAQTTSSSEPGLSDIAARVPS